MTQTDSISHPDSGFCRYTADMVLPLLKELDHELEGVKQNADIEYVHRSRVASRRLRAAVPIFATCLPDKKVKIWRREIKSITQSLGEARDLDVQISFVKKYIQSLTDGKINPASFFSIEDQESSDEYEDPSGFMSRLAGWIQRSSESEPDQEREKLQAVPGVECLLLRLMQLREQIQPIVNSSVDKIRKVGIIEEMAEYLYELQIRAILEGTDYITPYSYEKAFLHLMNRINALFWFEPYLAEETLIERHHEMRIAAKRLRYTMETFSGLFENQLKEEIKGIKSLQDLLGEMHDCDVWICSLPIFLQDEEREAHQYFGNYAFFKILSPGISSLISDRKQERSRLYSELIFYWERLKQEEFWRRLEAKLSISVQSVFKEEIGTKDNGPISIALISDIHANLPALQLVLADAESRGVTVVLNAGDSVGYGASPDQVVRLLRERHVLSVIGNYDQSVLEKKWRTGRPRSREKQIAMRWTYHNLSKENLGYLVGLPPSIRLRVRGTSILITHGSPDSITEYLVDETPDSRLKKFAASSCADIIVTGHSHLPVIKEFEGVWFVNCGSVGRTEDGDPRACYALLTLNPFSLKHIRVNYDIDQAVDKKSSSP